MYALADHPLKFELEYPSLHKKTRKMYKKVTGEVHVELPSY
jgi:hypothetical protein